MDSYLVEPGTRVNLSKFKTDDKSHFSKGKKDGVSAIQKNVEKLTELQERLYAENKHKVLIVLQGIDTAGKDGTIRHVFDGVNPQGVKVACFKQPTPIESAHDFLWRIHPHTPGAGQISIFNRSHYEDVLVVRVHELLPRKVWSKRYDHINNFEKMLTDEGTTIIKFFLHISNEEQKQRLLARLNTPDKQWKLSPSDEKERMLWPKYIKAYEDAISKTSTEWAPWYIIPSDRKWYRNWAVGEIIISRLKDLKIKKPKPRFDISTLKIV